MTALRPCPLCGSPTTGYCKACTETRETAEIGPDDLPPTGRRLSPERIDDLLACEAAWKALPDAVREEHLRKQEEASPDIAAAFKALPELTVPAGADDRILASIDARLALDLDAELGRSWLRLDAVTAASSEHFSSEGLYRPECPECVRLFAERTATWTLWNEVKEAARARYAAKKEQK